MMNDMIFILHIERAVLHFRFSEGHFLILSSFSFLVFPPLPRLVSFWLGVVLGFHDKAQVFELRSALGMIIRVLGCEHHWRQDFGIGFRWRPAEDMGTPHSANVVQLLIRTVCQVTLVTGDKKFNSITSFCSSLSPSLNPHLFLLTHSQTDTHRHTHAIRHEDRRQLT